VQGTLQEIVFALLESVEAQGQVRTLLLGAAETRPERTIFPYLVTQLDEVAAAVGDEAQDPKFIIPFPPNLEFFGRAEELDRLHEVLQGQAEQLVGPARSRTSLCKYNHHPASVTYPSIVNRPDILLATQLSRCERDLPNLRLVSRKF